MFGIPCMLELVDMLLPLSEDEVFLASNYFFLTLSYFFLFFGRQKKVNTHGID